MQTDILIENQKEFILGGRAYFTVESAETKNRFTYKINLCKNNKNMFFVSVCYAYESYNFIGNLFTNDARTEFKFVQSKKLTNVPKSVEVINFIVNIYLNNSKTHSKLIFYHHGNCCRCGRTLTTPESIKRGIGLFCASL